MIRSIRTLVIALAIGAAVAAGSGPRAALAASAAEIDRGVDAALQTLYEQIPAAGNLTDVAAGILVFPNVVKAGFIIGGQYGEGALRQNHRTVAYYNTVAASYGLQAGAQSFGYALFFMTDEALSYLDQSDGWEIGVGPSVVVVDEGLARTLTTRTARNDVYAFIFGQRGLMAGIGLQGSKISRVSR
jgi:lipid-binding SYLF domain-containing protein